MVVQRTKLKRVENAIPTDIGLFSGSAIHSATNKIHTFCVRLLTAIGYNLHQVPSLSFEGWLAGVVTGNCVTRLFPALPKRKTFWTLMAISRAISTLSFDNFARLSDERFREIRQHIKSHLRHLEFNCYTRWNAVKFSEFSAGRKAPFRALSLFNLG